MVNIEDIRTFCLVLPGTTEDLKWGNDLCFCLAGKMFCVTGLAGTMTISFKVTDEEFDEVSSSEGFIPAPYMARHKWVLLKDPGKITRKNLLAYIKQSYALVRSKLSKKALNGITFSP